MKGRMEKMQNSNRGVVGLVFGVIGCILAGISIIICGWLGFIGSALGFVGLVASEGRKSAIVCGLIALIVGFICGLVWAIFLSQLK